MFGDEGEWNNIWNSPTSRKLYLQETGEIFTVGPLWRQQGQRGDFLRHYAGASHRRCDLRRIAVRELRTTR